MRQALVNDRPVSILLVEDDDVDVMAVKRAFSKLKITNPLHVAKDGVEALTLLRGENGSKPLTRPFIILLDLNLPRMNGIEFLRQLRHDPELRSALIFVLTTSRDENDRVAAYELNVAGYIVKSKIGKDCIELVTMLNHYWKLIEFP